jgi:hypothetical protein
LPAARWQIRNYMPKISNHESCCCVQVANDSFLGGEQTGFSCSYFRFRLALG